MKRLFFGLVPDQPTRQNCTSILSELSSLNIQPVPPANLHVTLVFLGGIDDAREQALLEQAATVVFNPLTITFDQLNYWQKPGILCLTTQSMPTELLSLVSQLTAIAENLGIAIDERPYQAHVTLARKAKSAIEWSFKPIVWQADSFCLFESCASENGVEYSVLKRWFARVND